MKLHDLDTAVRTHFGDFVCEQINDTSITKRVAFRHVVTESTGTDDVPDVGRLIDVYDTFGTIEFYHIDESGEAAKYLAPPSKWEKLYDEFYLWVEDMLDHSADEDDGELAPELDIEPLPAWVDTCIVIGDVPRSGNFILVATEGDQAGHVFEFDHDGYEFTHQANDVVEYIGKLLKPDSLMLTEIASHMRFIEDGDDDLQWWIHEMKDNRGHLVTNVPLESLVVEQVAPQA